MPIQKFRSVADMPRPARIVGPKLEAHIRALWNRARLLAPPVNLPKGVTRFRSMDEANAARQQATIERMRASAKDD